MDEIEKLIKKIESLGHDVWIDEAASSDSIKILEEKLKIKLPSSFINFLTKYGAIGINDSYVSGIIENQPLDETAGSIYGDTLILRNEFELPSNLLVVSRHEDGAFCLDTNRMGNDREFHVVNFEFSSEQHKKPIAKSFNEWLISFFLEGWAEDES